MPKSDRPTISLKRTCARRAAWSFAALTALVRPAYAFAAGASVAVAFFLELERQNGTVDRLLALWRRREEERQLMELNRELTEQEKRGAAGREFFRKLLDERFSFIRTDGSTVDKDGFLIGLADAGNTSEVLTTQIRQVRVMGSQAFVEALVHLKGTRSGQPIEGTFRNQFGSSGLPYPMPAALQRLGYRFLFPNLREALQHLLRP